jgi:hypothetical protein
MLGDNGIESLASSVSGIDTVPLAPPLSTKTILGRGPALTPPDSWPLSRNWSLAPSPQRQLTSMDIPPVSHSPSRASAVSSRCPVKSEEPPTAPVAIPLEHPSTECADAPIRPARVSEPNPQPSEILLRQRQMHNQALTRRLGKTHRSRRGQGRIGVLLQIVGNDQGGGDRSRASPTLPPTGRVMRPGHRVTSMGDVRLAAEQGSRRPSPARLSGP